MGLPMSILWIRPRLFLSLAIGTLFLGTACGIGGGAAASPPVTGVNLYGSGINADDLANVVIGWDTATDTCNRSLGYRCRVGFTGSLLAIRPKFVWSTVKQGYSLGNGGRIQVQIQSDDGSADHYPSGAVLASLEYDQPITQGQYSPLLTFPNPAKLLAGGTYHVVFRNIAADPRADFVSLDHLYMWNANKPAQPLLSNLDLAVLERGGDGAWMVYRRGTGHSLTPILELVFEEGNAQGQGYVHGYGQTTSAGWVNPKPISGSQAVRETFTVSGTDRTVSSVSVRVNRVIGASPLAIRLERSDGTLVGQGSVLVPVGLVRGTTSNETWATVHFPTPVKLLVGAGYHLVLSCPADTIHTTHALEKGKASGYSPATYFTDGYAQFNGGAGWAGWDLFAVPNRRDCDLQFYFE